MKLLRYKKYYMYYKMTCNEFIQYVKENESLFINYCEIVIANDGTVLLPKNCGHKECRFSFWSFIHYNIHRNSSYLLLFNC